MEISENGMRMLVVGSDDAGTKIFSGIDDDERMSEGNYRGDFKDWASATVDGSMGCWTELDGIEEDVDFKV